MHLLESFSVALDPEHHCRVAHPTTPDQFARLDGSDAWLSGGTWLFAEPQAHLPADRSHRPEVCRRLPSLRRGYRYPRDLPVAQRVRFLPAEWIPALINQCRAARLLASFQDLKTSNRRATSACRCRHGPMISPPPRRSTCCTIGRPGGGDVKFPSPIFVIGQPAQLLAREGDLFGQSNIPLAALRRRRTVSPDCSLDAGRPLGGRC